MLNAVIVTIDVKAEFRERFIEESLLDAKGSVGTEPGGAHFDIVQDRTDPYRFYLYEVPADGEPFANATPSNRLIVDVKGLVTEPRS